ncbi:unnamed protein product [Nezara viridula]|uniref:Uncharacterized protein n=1 Tax=Nezara viridula TaxID=85310 RepID=A0A9P0HFW0_NEZVI|nr:unnamed protein product [Nezara viridula]
MQPAGLGGVLTGRKVKRDPAITDQSNPKSGSNDNDGVKSELTKLFLELRLVRKRNQNGWARRWSALTRARARFQKRRSAAQRAAQAESAAPAPAHSRSSSSPAADPAGAACPTSSRAHAAVWYGSQLAAQLTLAPPGPSRLIVIRTSPATQTAININTTRIVVVCQVCRLGSAAKQSC